MRIGKMNVTFCRVCYLLDRATSFLVEKRSKYINGTNGVNHYFVFVLCFLLFYFWCEIAYIKKRSNYRLFSIDSSVDLNINKLK